MRYLRTKKVARIAASLAIVAVLANIVLLALHAVTMAGRSSDPGAASVRAAGALICGPAWAAASEAAAGTGDENGGRPELAPSCAICASLAAAAWLAPQPVTADAAGDKIAAARFTLPIKPAISTRAPANTRSRGPPLIA